MLVYGGGSIKKNGLYEQIINACSEAKVKLFEHPGIEPNPRDVTIYQAALECRKYRVDLIIAAGGGSVIDASKVIGICATNPQYKDAWSYVTDSSLVTKPSIPLFSIVTLAATGSESNAGGVVTNATTHFKCGVGTPSAIPLVAFEDPKFTLTLSWWQTACGIFDIFSHLLEQYYDRGDHFAWTKQYILANMRVCVDCARKLAKNPQDLIARTNLLWTSSWALNGLPITMTTGGDWTTHRLEHAVSGLWDVEHGAGLALLTPHYLEYVCKYNKKFYNLSLEIGKDIFGVKTFPAYIKALKDFIKLLKLPTKFTDFNNIKKVEKADIEWLTKHFLTVTKSAPDSFNAKVADYVYNKVI